MSKKATVSLFIRQYGLHSPDCPYFGLVMIWACRSDFPVSGMIGIDLAREPCYILLTPQRLHPHHMQTRAPWGTSSALAQSMEHILGLTSCSVFRWPPCFGREDGPEART